jgi:hypothetical protein
MSKKPQERRKLVNWFDEPFKERFKESGFELISAHIAGSINCMRALDVHAYAVQGKSMSCHSVYGSTYFIMYHWLIDALINEIASIQAKYEAAASDCIPENLEFLYDVIQSSLGVDRKGAHKIDKIVSICPEGSFDVKNVEYIKKACDVRDLIYHYNADFIEVGGRPKAAAELIDTDREGAISFHWVGNLNGKTFIDRLHEQCSVFIKSLLKATREEIMHLSWAAPRVRDMSAEPDFERLDGERIIHI